MQRRRFIQAGLVMCVAGAADVAQAQTADDIAYGEHWRQRLDVYTPEARANAPRPIVVYFYGGSWRAGQRSDSRDIALALAARGVVTVTPDYRLFPEIRFPVFLDDAALAVRWARDHAGDYGGDPHRIFVMGHSSGAHIAAMLATDPRYLKAQGLSNEALAGMIGLAGPYAMIPPEPHMDEIFPEAQRAQALPIDVITGHEPPMLLATGTADKVVDPRNSDRFADALRAHDDRVEVKRYEGLGHSRIVAAFSAAQRTDSPVVADVAAFIDAH
jgi:acetyl esterase/lipase